VGKVWKGEKKGGLKEVNKFGIGRTRGRAGGRAEGDRAGRGGDRASGVVRAGT